MKFKVRTSFQQRKIYREQMADDAALRIKGRQVALSEDWHRMRDNEREWLDLRNFAVRVGVALLIATALVSLAGCSTEQDDVFEFRAEAYEMRARVEACEEVGLRAVYAAAYLGARPTIQCRPPREVCDDE